MFYLFVLGSTFYIIFNPFYLEEKYLALWNFRVMEWIWIWNEYRMYIGKCRMILSLWNVRVMEWIEYKYRIKSKIMGIGWGKCNEYKICIQVLTQFWQSLKISTKLLIYKSKIMHLLYLYFPNSIWWMLLFFNNIGWSCLVWIS